jgi:hypothetical protein
MHFVQGLSIDDRMVKPHFPYSKCQILVGDFMFPRTQNQAALRT